MRSIPLLLALMAGPVVCAQVTFALDPQSAEAPGCFFDGAMELLRAQNPHARAREQAMNDAITHRMRAAQDMGTMRGSELFIPVVVHIVHNGGPENISDAQVEAGIDDLNDAFGNTGAYNTGSGVDVGIRFCLAQQDPQGLPSSGITRHISTLTDVVAELNDEDLKNMVRWDPLRYLNIWLVREISTLSQGTGVAGYAYFPSSHGGPEDGIVNEAAFFGSSTDNSKVHIHEAGHYLGLYHTFEGGCANNNCLTNGDRVCDTPPDASVQPVSCGNNVNTCTTDDDDVSALNPFRPIGVGGLGDQNDLYRAYMDYGFQTCQNLFTAGQADRMYSALENERSSLLDSPGCTSGCGLAILYFDGWDGMSTPQTYLLMAPTVAGTQPYTTVWYVDGDPVSTDSTYMPGNLPYGDHVITFQVTNTSSGCIVEQTVTITILCTSPMYIQQSALQIDPGAPITFTTYIPPGVVVQWLLDGAPVGTGDSYTTTFPSAGYHAVALFADNGSCSDTTASLSFLVGECPSAMTTTWMLIAGNKLNFIGSPPAVLPSFSDPQYWAGEGVSCISDQRGREMIYTNGSTVWDSTLHMMMNGDSLRGGSSSSQAALIVPVPSLNGHYYLFTTDSEAGLYTPPTLGGALCYNEIDMSLNGGLGAVTAKNIALHPLATEKLTAVEHCNGHDVWVASHRYYSDAFYCYLVTDNGLDTVPVISHVGLVHEDIPGWLPGVGAMGCMKFSPQGDKLAIANVEGEFIQLFDFDTRSGMVSNPITLGNGINGYYSVEFSPDGSKLYATVKGDSWSEVGYVIQYDLSSGDETINNAVTYIGTQMQTWATASLQLARDNKIYITRTTGQWLDVINAPNELGVACGYQHNVRNIVVNGFGLNNFTVKNLAAQTVMASGPTYVCNYSDSVQYTVDCSHPANNQWIYHGPNDVMVDTDSLFILDFHTAGVDTLIAVKMNGCEPAAYDTLFIEVDLQLPLLGPDRANCVPVYDVLTPGEGYASYLWQDGSTNSTLPIASTGTYSVTVTGLGGCSLTDTIAITEFANPLILDLGPDTTVCVSGTIEVQAPVIPGVSYMWSNGSTATSFTHYYYTRSYWLRITDTAGCVASDTLLITMWYPDPYFTLGNDTLLCGGDIMVLQPQQTGAELTYVWQDGSAGDTYTIWQPGTYWATSNTECNISYTDTVVVGSCLHTGVEEEYAGTGFLLLPNPAANSTMVVPSQGARILQLTVHGALGQLILDRRSGDPILATGSWSPGIYLVTVETEDSHWIGRLIKE